MMRFVGFALILATPAEAATLPNPNWPGAADRSPQHLRNAVVTAHNTARASFGVAPVGWSEALADEAMVHAEYMARTGMYGHDGTPGRRKKMGENLWRGQR